MEAARVARWKGDAPSTVTGNIRKQDVVLMGYCCNIHQCLPNLKRQTPSSHPFSASAVWSLVFRLRVLPSISSCFAVDLVAVNRCGGCVMWCASSGGDVGRWHGCGDLLLKGGK